MVAFNMKGNELQVDGVTTVSGPTGAALTVKPKRQAGAGVPSHSAPKGTVYINTSGSSTSTRAYINTDGGTTWTSFTTAA